MKYIVKGYNPDYAEGDPAPEQIMELTGDAVLEFGAPWCGYCQTTQPALQEVLGEHPEIHHIRRR